MKLIHYHSLVEDAPKEAHRVETLEKLIIEIKNIKNIRYYWKSTEVYFSESNNSNEILSLSKSFIKSSNLR